MPQVGKCLSFLLSPSFTFRMRACVRVRVADVIIVCGVCSVCVCVCVCVSAHSVLFSVTHSSCVRTYTRACT
jgi:hypothetical protein